MLNMTAQYVKLTLRWVKAHDVHRGNNRANRLAKEGARGTNLSERYLVYQNYLSQ